LFQLLVHVVPRSRAYSKHTAGPLDACGG
jgi:hypothetical protein